MTNDPLSRKEIIDIMLAEILVREKQKNAVIRVFFCLETFSSVCLWIYAPWWAALPVSILPAITIVLLVVVFCCQGGDE